MTRFNRVAIDPWDSNEVDRLIDLILATDHGLNCESSTCRRDTLRDCLIAFGNPVPEEPRGLGAVVRDASGRRWVRLGESGIDDWRMAGIAGGAAGGWHRYDDFRAVSVLSPGVTS